MLVDPHHVALNAPVAAQAASTQFAAFPLHAQDEPHVEDHCEKENGEEDVHGFSSP